MSRNLQTIHISFNTFLPRVSYNNAVPSMSFFYLKGEGVK